MGVLKKIVKNTIPSSKTKNKAENARRTNPSAKFRKSRFSKNALSTSTTMPKAGGERKNDFGLCPGLLYFFQNSALYPAALAQFRIFTFPKVYLKNFLIS